VNFSKNFPLISGPYPFFYRSPVRLTPLMDTYTSQTASSVSARPARLTPLIRRAPTPARLHHLWVHDLPVSFHRRAPTPCTSRPHSSRPFHNIRTFWPLHVETSWQYP